MATIALCTCVHAGQDRLHGPGMRVFNLRSDGTFRCTVCGRTVATPRPPDRKKKEHAR